MENLTNECNLIVISTMRVVFLTQSFPVSSTISCSVAARTHQCHMSRVDRRMYNYRLFHDEGLHFVGMLMHACVFYVHMYTCRILTIDM